MKTLLINGSPNEKGCTYTALHEVEKTLNKYFTINNMPVVSSQYWNQVHGFTPEDVMKDEEGLQTMRTLGENMVWLLNSIEAGRKNGVPAPQYEERMRTHFIR